MPLDFRITVYQPNAPAGIIPHDNASAIIINDASEDAMLVQYEDTPTGCGAGKLTLRLYREDVDTLGYYEPFNLFEISSGDMRLTTACAAGATKVYLDATEPLDPAQGEDAQILYFWDGANLTMRVPVISIGSDSGGYYANIGAPDGIAGNPSTLPAYGAGAIVGRRRYVGRLALTSSVESRSPGVDITLVGLTVAWTQANGSVTITSAANVDVAVALYEVLLQFASSHWPFFSFVQANFPTTGFIYSDTLTQVTMDRFIADALSAIPNADAWYLRVGHDRAPRLVHAFTASSNTYTYNRTLLQGVTNFEAQQVEIDENNIANTYNAVTVTGGNAVGTQTPVTAQVTDPLSIDSLGFQIDGPPASNSAINTITAAANFGAGLLAQNSLATAANRFVIWTDDDAPTALFPGGPLRGDVVRGLQNVAIQRFDKIGLVTNFVPDSVIEYGTTLNASTGLYEVGPDTLWTVYGTPIPAVVPSAAPDGYDVWQFTAPNGALVYSPPIAVNPGDTYTFGAYVNTSLVTGTLGSCGFGISSSAATGATDIAITTVTGDVNETYAPQTFVIPAGVETIYFWFYWQPPTSGTTGQVRFSDPNLVRGSKIKPYVPNTASPTLYGLSTSVVTTINLKALTSKQEVQFAAIVPDWAFYAIQRVNAAVTALLVNKQTPVSIDQYCVSTNARDFTTSTSSLNVAFPAFLALFAPQTNLISVAAQNVALEANQTNYVYLEQTGSATAAFSVLQAPPSTSSQITMASSAILIAYFTTSGAGVMGSFFCAPVGVFMIGVGNINQAGDLPEPTYSGTPTITNAASLNGVAADVDVAITLTNVPTNGDATQAVFFFLVYGTTTWIPYGSVNLALASGTIYPSNPQTVTFTYGGLASGTLYDFAVAYEGLLGYGPLRLFSYGFGAQEIGIPVPYLLSGSTIAPSFSSTTVENGTSANGVNADVVVLFNISNQPQDGSLSRVNLWVRVSGSGGGNVIGVSGFAWSPYSGQPAVGVGSSSPPAAGDYKITIADLTNGQSYDFAASFEDAQGQESTLGVIATNFAALALNLANQANTPMDPTIKADGPDITASNPGTLTASGSGAVGVPIFFDIADWTAGNAPKWFSGFATYWRIHGTTVGHAAGLIGYTEAVLNISAAVLVPSSTTVDIGIAYVGVQSDQSTVVFPTGLSGIATPFPVAPGVPAGASITLGTPTYTTSSSTSTTVSLNVEVAYTIHGTTDTSWISAFYIYFGYYDPTTPGKSALLTQFPVLIPPTTENLIFGTTLNANSSTSPVFRYYFYIVAVAGNSDSILQSNASIVYTSG